jgi:uncharacterized membrane protein
MLNVIPGFFGLIGLALLLGGATYESVVMAPNYKTNIPDSLKHVRQFMIVTTPANYFRLISPLTMLILLVNTLFYWSHIPSRWFFLAALALLVITDTITYSFHVPRNKVLFIQPLITDTGKLVKYARDWARANYIRIILLVLAFFSAFWGIFSLAA